MIKLNLAGTVSRTVSIRRMRPANRQAFRQDLQRFSSSPHVQVRTHHVEITGMFGPSNRIPDVDRYRVTISNGLYSVRRHSSRTVAASKNRFCDRPTNQQDFDGTILFLLESPHKDEYDNNNIACPIAPAQGQTGTKINNFLECVLNAPCNRHLRSRIRNNYRIIIANPIQFQTSLWVIHRGGLCRDWHLLRDATWKTLWDMPEIRREFCCRVRSYNPHVVLNCCTSQLRESVTSFLRHFCFTSQMHIYQSCHPSAWNCGIQFYDPLCDLGRSSP